jgi:hypothetical protein
MFDTRNLLLLLDGLFIEWPELADDEQLKRHVLDNGTDYRAALKVAFEEMREADLLSDAIRNRVGELSLRKARCDRKSDAMRSLMQKLMEHAREHKVVLTEATLSLAIEGACLSNGGISLTVRTK